MREQRSPLSGDQIISEPLDMRALVAGNVTVAAGGKVYLRGVIHGNLTLQNGGRAHLYGVVQGNVQIEAGAKLIHGGMVGGSIHNAGGRLYVEKIAKTEGKIKTEGGETTFQQ